MAIVNEALKLASFGWPILPLKPGDKTPDLRNGVKGATTNPTTIQNWWNKRPDAGIGIAGGNGRVILDIDPRHSGHESLLELEAEFGALPATVECVTGGDGRHLYFATSEDLGNRSNIRPGLDTRGRNGYVVAPPSLHKSGKNYVWREGHAPGEIELAPLPDWLLQLIQKPAVKTISNYESALAACLRIKKPDGNDGSKRLFAVCCRGVGFALSDDEIFQLVRDVHNERPFPQNFSDADIRPRIRDAERRVERGSELIVKPKINVTNVDLAVLTDRIWDIVKEKNNPPKLYRYGGNVARVELSDTGEPLIQLVGNDELCHQIAQWFYFYKVSKDGQEYSVAPPERLISNLRATPDKPLPILNRLIESPSFAFDGSLLTTPGYHPAARTLYVPQKDFAIRDVPAKPTVAEIKSAREMLLEPFVDFPFVSESELTNLLALVLLPYARDMIDGPTPFFLIEKPTEGTGGTLATVAATYPAVGHQIAAMTEAKNEDEMRKRLIAKFRQSPTYIFFDNMKDRLDSPSLCAALTANFWEDRLLGLSATGRFPIRCCWIGTGNNPTIDKEIARRTVRIRLNAKVERPWLRSEFKHPDLIGWIKQNRSELVWSALTLCQAWIAAGRPAGKKTLGMYEDFSRVVGGILSVAGIDGFLENLVEFYDAADSEGAAWRSFIAQWWKEHQSSELTASTLFPLAAAELDSALGTGNERSQQTKLGKLLSEQRDRVYTVDDEAGPTIIRIDRAGTRHRAGVWRLAPLTLAG